MPGGERLLFCDETDCLHNETRVKNSYCGKRDQHLTDRTCDDYETAASLMGNGRAPRCSRAGGVWRSTDTKTFK